MKEILCTFNEDGTLCALPDESVEFFFDDAAERERFEAFSKSGALAAAYKFWKAGGKQPHCGCWIDESGEGDCAVCSECGECFDTTEAETEWRKAFELFKQFYRYCPCCGALMTEGVPPDEPADHQ